MKFQFQLIVLLMSAVVLTAQAQSSAQVRSIRGNVQDTSGAVIPGAQIDILTLDGKMMAQGRSDTTGNFSFTGLPNGSYVVDVTELGFRETRQQAKATLEVRSQIRIVMPVATVTQEVTVGASDNAAQISTEISQNQSCRH